MAVRIVNWNLAWAASRRPKGIELRRRIMAESTDIVCLTEAMLGFLEGDHTVASTADYGYANTGSRRKVQLWSRQPWTNVDVRGDTRLPSGRFVRATTDTPLGPVTCLGVCIPWKDAHVQTGRRDRQRWEDHLAYVDGLAAVLAGVGRERVVLLGDFNQTIPRTRAPLEAYDRLMAVLQGLQVATSGESVAGAGRAIDHICHTADLACRDLHVLDKHHAELGRLSDHFGWSATITMAGQPRQCE